MESLNVLLPPRAEREKHVTRLVSLMNDFWDLIRDRPIGPMSQSAERQAWLSQFNFHSPLPLDALMPDVVEKLFAGTLLTQHPACLGLFNPTPAFPGVLADLMTAGLNPQLAVWSHAPLAVEIEAHVIDALGSRLGWNAPRTGHFTSGGAEANMTALLMAQLYAEPEFAENGARAFDRQPTFYASGESHSAWFKIAHQIGIGRSAVRLVPTDGTGRMCTAALADMITADKAAGLVPTMVAATAGTTNAGMVDPLQDCARVAHEHDLWYHVDAAWGGALICSNDHRGVLAGVELADSVTIDAHKWFSVPMGAGMLLTRDQEALARTFRVDATYMPASDAAIDPYTHSAQWSRRFMGLKLFMSLAVLGWRGYAKMIKRQLKLATELRHLLECESWIVENASPMAVICIRDAGGGDSAAIVEKVQARGKVWLSLAKFEGRPVIRACVTSFRTEAADLEMVVSELRLAREHCASAQSASDC